MTWKATNFVWQPNFLCKGRLYHPFLVLDLPFLKIGCFRRNVRMRPSASCTHIFVFSCRLLMVRSHENRRKIQIASKLRHAESRWVWAFSPTIELGFELASQYANNQRKSVHADLQFHKSTRPFHRESVYVKTSPEVLLHPITYGLESSGLSFFEIFCW